MAKTKRYQQQQKQLILVIYLQICFVVVSLLMKVDGVKGANMPLDGSGNILQQQQQEQQQHVIDNSVQEHNFIMDLAKQNNSEDEDDEAKKTNFDLMNNQLVFGPPFETINVEKRASGGFVGMRGKKLYEENESSREDNNENDLNFNLPWQELPNSGVMFDWSDYAKPNVRRYKKAPNAFYGVRGKKFVAMNGINSNNDNNNNRWHDFLQQLEEERIRDAIIQDFVERLAGTKSDVTNDMAKRAPTGFTGVRGKRTFFDELDGNAMESLSSKRGLGNNAFIGVRGKKDVWHQTVKRSPTGPERYFFGFWKKSYPGRSGKRQRFVDFSNKFVAVRGKKSSYNDLSTLNAISNNLGPLDTGSLLTSYDKRTPKGFLGMRGKRTFTTDDI